MPARLSLLRAALIIALVAASGHRAAALVVAPPASNNNITAPVDDPGWLNVGDRGVYLGNRWVLTVSHVGAGATFFPGVGSFAYETGTSVRLANPTGLGLTTLTDLVLYRLTTAPNLPSLTISTGTPAVNAQVTLIGDGRAVAPTATETEWFVTGSGTNYTWTEVAPGNGNALGYKSTASVKLWGTNLVEDDVPFFSQVDPDHNVNVNSGSGDVISFFTEFDKTGITGGLTTNSESQALGGDSGSGVFAKNGANWELAGITHAIGVFEDQPGFQTPTPSGPQTAVYGDLTYIADLFAYRDQILTITAVPELGSFLLVGAFAAIAGARRVIRR